MATIFISYRRDDSIDITGRIFDRVIGRFGKGVVFKDVDSLIGGQNFPEVLRQSIQRNTVMLVIIGRSWLGITQARANDPNDYARIEIETALQRRATIIPVLIQGAQMPRRDQLPPSIADLANRHATSVRPDPDFTPDMNGVVRAIAPHMRSVGQRIARLTVPLGTLTILAVVAALVVPRYLAINPIPFISSSPCTQVDDKITAVTQTTFLPAKTDGIDGQLIHVMGSGNAESSLIDVRPPFNAVNKTCITIDRGGGGWTIKQPNEIGVTDFSIAYDLRSRTTKVPLEDHWLAIIPEIVIVGTAVYARGIHDLSRAQLTDIFDGKTTDWSQIDGGPSLPIDTIRRTDDGVSNNISGISLTFKKTVMRGLEFSKQIHSTDGSLATLENVATSPSSISYIALQALDYYTQTGYPQFKDLDHAISINGYNPDLANIEAGYYEFWDFAHGYTVVKANDQTKAGKAVNALIAAVRDSAFEQSDFPAINFLPVDVDKLRKIDQDCRSTIDPCSGS